MDHCASHDDCNRRMDDMEKAMEALTADVNILKIESAAKGEQIKTVFSVLAEIKQMLKDYTVEMKEAITRLSLDIEFVKGRPGRFADGALSSIISSIIAAIIGVVIGYVVKGGVK